MTYIVNSCHEEDLLIKASNSGVPRQQHLKALLDKGFTFFFLSIYFISSNLEFNPVEAAVFSLPVKPQDYA